MKASKIAFIIFLIISVVLIFVGAYLAFAYEELVSNIGAFVMFGGFVLPLFAIINFALKARLIKRYNAVKAYFANLGEGVYVQGACGSKRQDRADGAKNSAGFGGALLFASLFGAGVWTVHDSRKRLEFYFTGNRAYAGVFTLGLWSYEYSPVDDMREIDNGWFIRHTVEAKGKKIILTGADGDSYFSFDLTSCSADKERLLATLQNVFGVAANADNTQNTDNPSPFGDL